MHIFSTKEKVSANIFVKMLELIQINFFKTNSLEIIDENPKNIEQFLIVFPTT
jgi:hypothetical protein